MSQNNEQTNAEEWHMQEDNICLTCGKQHCYCAKKPFKVRSLGNGTGVIDVIGEDGLYHRDPLCNPVPFWKAARRADVLNTESEIRLREGKDE